MVVQLEAMLGTGMVEVEGVVDLSVRSWLHSPSAGCGTSCEAPSGSIASPVVGPKPQAVLKFAYFHHAVFSYFPCSH